jgi:5-methylthioribose kinase
MIDLQEDSPIELIRNLPYWNKDEIAISATPAGESNMNLVLRVLTNQRSVILKQSKSFVRKFPQIPAPIQRIEVEYAFYRLLQGSSELRDFSPKVIHFDAENYILLTEDLGAGSDFIGLYSKAKNLDWSQIRQLGFYLKSLHSIKPASFPSNLEMKKLNHEHIFNFPFIETNGMNLDAIQQGLQELSIPFKRNSALKIALKKLGDRYLATGNTLIQGDFYPASWLEIDQNIKVIDPEFGFLGDAEFDLGVLFAHLKLSQQSSDLKTEFLDTYSSEFDEKLVAQYENVEIMRRLIGIAQLPLILSLGAKQELLTQATETLTAS